MDDARSQDSSRCVGHVRSRARVALGHVSVACDCAAGVAAHWFCGTAVSAVDPQERRLRHTRSSTALASTCFALLVLLPSSCGDRAQDVKQEPPEGVASVRLDEAYWPDGTQRLRREVEATPDGALVNHGKFTRWHRNGSMEYQATFVHGKKHGIATRWHQDGRKASEESYADGKRHGTSRTWAWGGGMNKEEHHHHGKPVGIWTVWSGSRIKSRQDFGPAEGGP